MDFGWFISIAVLITCALCCNNSFLRPAPIPVTSCGSHPAITDIIAADGVVFAIVHSDFKPLQFVKPGNLNEILNDNFQCFY